jgi:hypothetical protein
MSVSLFNLTWTGLASFSMSGSSEHARFNEKFTRLFPKRLYTVPYSNYTGWGIGITPRLYCLGETVLDPETTRLAVIGIAREAGFSGNESGIRFSQDLIGQNTTIHDPGTSISPWMQSNLGDPYPSFFGVPWWAVGAGGVVLLALLLRR